MKKEWPNNILDEIFGSEEMNQYYSAEYVDFVIRKFLETFPEKIEIVILDHFKKGMTYEACGKRFGWQKTRAQQLASKGIRMLKNGYRSAKIKEAMDVTNPYELLYDRIAKNNKLERELSELRTDLANARAVHPDLDAQINKYLIDKDGYALEELDLSVKAYNALRRARIESTKELVEILKENPKKIFEINNLGEKHINEILNKLNNTFGYSFSYEALKALQQ